ncbi:hypothetical protein AB5I41_10100 [Sphingomonas sp. MMS24-JH45]
MAAQLPHAPGVGVDLATGSIVVSASRGDVDALGADVIAERLAAIAGVPVRVRGDGVAVQMAAAEGGARVMAPIPAIRSATPAPPASSSRTAPATPSPPRRIARTTSTISVPTARRRRCPSSGNGAGAIRTCRSTPATLRWRPISSPTPPRRGCAPSRGGARWPRPVRAISSAIAASGPATAAPRCSWWSFTRGRIVRRAVHADLDHRRGAGVQGRRQRRAGVPGRARLRHRQGRQLPSGRQLRLLLLHVDRLSADRLAAARRYRPGRGAPGAARTGALAVIG